MEHRRALLILNMLPGVGPARKRILERCFGSVESALEASHGELCRCAGIGGRVADELRNWRSLCDPDAELRLAEQSGVRILNEEDAEYPPLLREIHDPPICLYALGDSSLLAKTEMALGIVGSRCCTAYGQKMAGHFAEEASRAGWPVVSGLARGIDTAAHEATLRAGGCTIAVIGGGLTKIYPRENIGLAARIAAGGGVLLSEFSLCYTPDRRSFPMRNRIISGISRGTLVVEAGCQSGSLITAAQAMEQGRAVFAVPGRADTPFARGCHALLRDGAVLAESFEDLVNEYTLLPGLKPPPKEPQAAPPPRVSVASLHLSGLEEKLLRLMREGVLQMDLLLERSEEEPQCVLSALLAMELKRLVRQCPGRMLELLV